MDHNKPVLPFEGYSPIKESNFHLDDPLIDEEGNFYYPNDPLIEEKGNVHSDGSLTDEESNLCTEDPNINLGILFEGNVPEGYYSYRGPDVESETKGFNTQELPDFEDITEVKSHRF